MSDQFFLNINPQNELLQNPEKMDPLENLLQNGLNHKISISSSSQEDQASIKQGMSYQEIVHHCESTSTVHGICHAGNALNKKSRLFWHITFLVNFSFLCIQCLWMCQKYLQYDKTVDLDVSF